MAKSIGQRVSRIDGTGKVSGRMQYCADLNVPELVWGATLRSPLPHAKILQVDASRAKAVPGVRAVLTGRDLPESRVGRQIRDMPVLASDKVRFLGEKVAAGA